MNLEKVLGGLFVGALLVLLSWVIVHRTPDAVPGPIPDKVAKRQLVYFGATWCLPCRQMQKTFTDPAVVSAMGRYAVTHYDMDRDRDLAGKHSVMAVPTYLILDAAGKEVRRGSGYKSPADFAAWLNQ